VASSWQTTANHPTANGLVERFHRMLKAAIVCHADQQWTEALLLVLLGIRTAFKEDLRASVAELVYGEPIRIPGELLTPTTDPAVRTHLITELRQHMAHLRLVSAARHGIPATFMHGDLEKCPHVFLHQDTVRRALEPPTAASTVSYYGERRCCNSCAGGPSPYQLVGSSRPTSSMGLTAGTTPSTRRWTQPQL
jgi:hypothetical protein